MKIDLSKLKGLDYEFTIIGAGPAGMSLALGLAKKGKKVLLLEAGSYNYSDKSQIVYDGKIIGPYSEGLGTSTTSTRLRFFGGSSNHWGGMCRPLDNIDFDKYPISKSDIDTYLPEACNILEIQGNFKDLPISSEFKQIDFQWSTPVRFGQKYRKYFENSELVDFALNSNVLSIRESSIEGTAEFLEIADENFELHKIPVNNLIVACGGIENNRLLLWSQLLNKKLFSDLSIGGNWMEHPHFTTGNMIANYPEIYDIFDTSSRSFSDLGLVFLAPTENLIKSENIGNAGIRLSILPPSDNIVKTQQVINDILCKAPSFGKKLAKLANNNLVCSVLIQMAWEQKPHFKNRIELDFNDKDIYGVPKVKLLWKYYQDDKRTAQICMKKLGELVIAKSIGRVGYLPYLDINGDDMPAEYKFFIGGHHMGGTSMGSSVSDGVVDSNLKVFNTENIWVAGSSIFTEGGHTNPTLPIVQFSLRLADHLS